MGQVASSAHDIMQGAATEPAAGLGASVLPERDTSTKAGNNLIVTGCAHASQRPKRPRYSKYVLVHMEELIGHKLQGYLIPSCADQDLYAQSRNPRPMMRQGWSVSLFLASQQ